jgi:hypothetical protein
VLQAPRPVFRALRDDSAEAAADRAEPVLLVILLAGTVGVLSTSTAGRLMDDPSYDGLLVAVWAFIGGGIYGIAAYWILGAFLYGACRWLGSLGSYRRSRHVLAFAAVPVACSLVLWPVKLAMFGSDVFHRGGSDAGARGDAFAVLELAFVAWSVALLVIGVRAVHGWTWERAAGAVAILAGLSAGLSYAAATL